MTDTLILDFETQGAADISWGAYRYAEHSRPLLAQYALNDGPVQVWHPQWELMPADLHGYLQDPTIQIACHNVAFDRTCMLAWGWAGSYDLNPRRFLCTMTWARMCRLPGGLDELCQVLGVPDQYSKKQGKALIRLFCIPKQDGSFNAPQDHPKEWAEFVQYGVYDIIATRECMKRMPDVFNAVERELYAMTCNMNDKGIRIDRDLATMAMATAEELKIRYKKEGSKLAAQAEADRWGSAEEVQAAAGLSITSQKAVLDFISSYGVKLEDARAATIEKFLASEKVNLLPDNVRSLLATRLKANKASVAKYSAVLKRANSDGRIRGLITPHGAGTGRDVSSGFQTQNLARPVLLGKHLTMEDAVKIVKTGLAEMHFDDPMQLLSDCVRGVLIPSEGCIFAQADLSAIEGRVLPWLAKEEWMVQYFRDLDTGRVKYDGYELAYATAFGVDPNTVTKEQRTIGKPIELGLGFGGGTGALITFATLYRIDIDDMARKAHDAADTSLWRECAESYEWYREKDLTNDLPEFTWTGCQYIVKAWRNRRSLTAASWKTCEEAFENAMRNPGVYFEMANRTYAYGVANAGSVWVFVILPSGRSLVYPQAHYAERGGRKQLAYMGVNPFTRKWGAVFTYSGRLAENITQAVARDALFWSLPHVEAAGYTVVTRIHDELLTEVPIGSGLNGAGLARIMSQPHSWCPDLPLNAVGEDLTRYQK